MAAPDGNAVDFFVDRHIRDGGGERIAFVDPWRHLSYAALQAETGRFAAALRGAGIEREQRIALLMLDTVDFPIAFWGALRAGVIPVPINTLLPSDLVGYILEDCRAAALFVSGPLMPALAPTFPGLPGLRRIVVAAPEGGAAQSPPELAGDARLGDLARFLAEAGADTGAAECSPDEVAFWLYSSGSTGAPKGVRHVHSSLRATADTYAREVLRMQPDDLMFSAAKLFFAYGLGNSMTFPMAVGAGAVLLPDRPSPDAVLGMMRRFRPSLFAGVPTLYAALLAHPALGQGAGSDRLRGCISAGEPLPEHIGRRWRDIVGSDILDGIGSTEMLHIFLSNRPEDVRYGTTGKPVPGYRARILDPDGREVAAGEEGELVVSGPSAAEGYWNQRDKSRRTFRGEWTHTGDVYIRDAEGYFRYCGRTDDMLKVGGIWVSPFEVEEALIAHPAILEAAVVAHADADGLIKPKAFVVLQQTAANADHAALREQLQAHVKDRIGVWKYPRWIEFPESLPKTATGKIQRFKLREDGPSPVAPSKAGAQRNR
ncbi:MAG: benzoate-CoA ligase family protein [Alphaproteobacteria bacterium]|nr:benzoate-CoA ligase family protein [Alphaproteobacteria bacterium]